MHESLIRAPVKSLVKPLLFLGTLLAAGVPLLNAQREKLPPEDLEFVEQNWPEAKKTTTGIRYIVLREGQGETPKPGDKCQVLYVGRLLHGQIFDQKTEKSDPFVFRVRRDEVIEGWDQLVQQMKPGEKRLAIIPPELAYGSRGRPPSIPRSATLVFEMELIDVKRN